MGKNQMKFYGGFLLIGVGSVGVILGDRGGLLEPMAFVFIVLGSILVANSRARS